MHEGRLPAGAAPRMSQSQESLGAVASAPACPEILLAPSKMSSLVLELPLKRSVLPKQEDVERGERRHEEEDRDGGKCGHQPPGVSLGSTFQICHDQTPKHRPRKNWKTRAPAAPYAANLRTQNIEQRTKKYNKKITKNQENQQICINNP